jgi:hypothetical protein
MQEYLRRAALWSRELGTGDDWPWGDIAARVVPDVQPLQGMAEQVEKLISQHSMWPPLAATCRGALHWAALLDSGTAIPNLPDPYEPLLLMFERGGGFMVENRFIDLDGASVVRQTMDFCLAMTPFTDLSPEALNALDAPKPSS